MPKELREMVVGELCWICIGGVIHKVYRSSGHYHIDGERADGLAHNCMVSEERPQKGAEEGCCGKD